MATFSVIQISDLRLFYECGKCGLYHKVGFSGKCSDKSSRFEAGELDEKYGVVGWNEVTGGAQWQCSLSGTIS